MHLIIALSSLILLNSTSYGLPPISSTECAPVNLNGPGQSMEKIPVTDQRDLGICYAHSASDLADAYRFSHGDKNSSHLTSPLALAIECESIKPPTSSGEFLNAGGDVGNALSQLKIQGSCDTHLDGDGCNLECQLKLLDMSSSDDLQCYLQTEMGTSFPTFLNVNNVLNTLTRGDRDSYRRTVSEKLLEACKGIHRVAVRIPDPTQKEIQSIQDFRTSVSDIFDHQLSPKQPFSISYCADLLTQGKDYQGLLPLERRREGDSEVVSQKCRAGDDHASTVTGRRFKDGKCQVQIKNSWGTSCFTYSKDWECQEGKIWVDLDVLGANTMRTVYLK